MKIETKRRLAVVVLPMWLAACGGGSDSSAHIDARTGAGSSSDAQPRAAAGVLTARFASAERDAHHARRSLREPRRHDHADGDRKSVV